MAVDFKKEIHRCKVKACAFEKIEAVVNDLQNTIKATMTRSIYDGVDTEQARNTDGELLYKKDGEWRCITADRIPDGERELYKPYYRDKFHDETVNYSDLEDYNKITVDACEELILYLAKYGDKK